MIFVEKTAPITFNTTLARVPAAVLGERGPGWATEWTTGARRILPCVALCYRRSMCSETANQHLRLKPVTVLLMLLLTFSSNVPAATVAADLPDIGDPASAVLSRAQERELGKALLAQIRGNLRLVKDPELTSYIQSLGERLLTSGVGADIDFSFLLIDDNSINAFAAPGGIVATNSGLLITASQESELAAVMAHEIAHVTQRHLARTYANASTVNVSTALGVLAAVVAGLYNSELGQAALYGSLAAGAQSQLAFTRGNETEADTVGIQLLAGAGFDPHGMPTFLQRLHKATQLNIGPVPEFLSTHPVTLSRIADTRSRADRLSGDFREDSPQFQFAKARATALGADPNVIITDLERLQRSGAEQTENAMYAYAIALTRAGYARKAGDILADMQHANRDSVPINLALAQARMKQGRLDEAMQVLTRLDNLYPAQEPIVYYLAEALIEQGDAQRALGILDRHTRNGSRNPELNKLKARAAAEANQPWLSHESTADYYVAYGQYEDALEQFDLALNGTADAATTARLTSKRKEVVRITEKN